MEEDGKKYSVVGLSEEIQKAGEKDKDEGEEEFNKYHSEHKGYMVQYMALLKFNKHKGDSAMQCIIKEMSDSVKIEMTLGDLLDP